MPTQRSTIVHRTITRRIFAVTLLVICFRGATCAASDRVSCAMPIEQCESADGCSCGQCCECQTGPSDRCCPASENCCCCRDLATDRQLSRAHRLLARSQDLPPRKLLCARWLRRAARRHGSGSVPPRPYAPRLRARPAANDVPAAPCRISSALILLWRAAIGISASDTRLLQR